MSPGLNSAHSHSMLPASAKLNTGVIQKEQWSLSILPASWCDPKKKQNNLEPQPSLTLVWQDPRETNPKLLGV